MLIFIRSYCYLAIRTSNKLNSLLNSLLSLFFIPRVSLVAALNFSNKRLNKRLLYSVIL